MKIAREFSAGQHLPFSVDDERLLPAVFQLARAPFFIPDPWLRRSPLNA